MIDKTRIAYGRSIVQLTPDANSSKAASVVGASNNAVSQTAAAMNQVAAQNGGGGGAVVPKANMVTPQMYHTLTDAGDMTSANNFPLPNTVTVRAASATGAGAVATRVYIFNQASLLNVTNNGSGAASITYTYLDGFAGANISQLMALSRAGIGAICYGVALRFNITATGAGDPTGLGISNPFFATNNAYGQPLPLNMNMTGDQTRGDFDTSIEVNRIVQNMAAFVQFSFILPVGDSAIATLYLTKEFKN